MRKAYRYRLYPNTSQIAELNRTLNACRWLYNAMLADRRDLYQYAKCSTSKAEQHRWLTTLKTECPHLIATYSQVLHDVVKRVDRAFQAFFRRCKRGGKRPGYPRFRGAHRYDSFCYPQFGFRVDGTRLHLSKIGAIKVRQHRPIEGTVKTCTIKREVDQWFVVFSCELPDTVPSATNTTVGIDVGIESFLTTSEGERVGNPKYLQSAQKRVRVLSRALARKKKRSCRRVKARTQLAKCHRKVSRQRLDFQHKTARVLVNRYDLLCVEDLNVAGMVKNHRLAKSISDAAWSQFVNVLSFKAEGAGKTVVRVPARNTSQACSQCGTLVRKALSQRWHDCPDCGLSLHRDHNAARNILRLGRSRQALTGTASVA